jgi:single-strand DNA-binding protein
MIGVRLLALNRVSLVGRLTHDPDVRFTQKGNAMCRFQIAVNRRYKDSVTGEWKDDTSFVHVVAWRETAERCKEKLAKGSPVYVDGRLKSREYDDQKTGQKRSVLEVEAREVQSLALAKAGEGAGSEAPAPAAGKKSAGAADEGGTTADEMEEVPF